MGCGWFVLGRVLRCGVILGLGVCGLLFAIRRCRAWVLLLVAVFCCLS